MISRSSTGSVLKHNLSKELKNKELEKSRSTSNDVYVTRTRSVMSQWLHGRTIRRNPSELIFRSADIIKEGYLQKQGTRLKMWTKRYFILRLEIHHMTLGYYTSRDDLTLCLETPIGPGHRLFDRSTSKHPYRLELHSGSRSLVLEADSSDDFSSWKIALEEAIRWNETMVKGEKGKVETYGNHAKKQIEAEKKTKNELLEKKKLEKESKNRPKYLPATREGNQCFMASNARFDIPLKFKYQKTIGSGAYGVVISAKDEELKKDVAIKNIQKAFDDLTDAKRIVREIKLMKHLKHKNILGVTDILPPLSLDSFEDVYIVSDCMATDLHRVIYSRHALSNEHLAYFMYQMLCALKYIHSANVIHRDLKPSNILVNGNCELKICDFGLARGVLPDIDSELTEYVVTRWYRAPEIMLGCMKYTSDVDVWALGCIFGEMIARKPIFPGQDYIDQLHLIMNTIGTLEDDELGFLTNPRARKFMNSERKKRGNTISKPLEKIFKNSIHVEALDLIKKMLVIDPNKRISVDDALSHPYFASIRTVEDETVAESLFDFNFELDNVEFEKKDLQKLIWDEMIHFHPECDNNNVNIDINGNDPINQIPMAALIVEDNQIEHDKKISPSQNTKPLSSKTTTSISSIEPQDDYGNYSNRSPAISQQINQ